ncbi:hypothetical protein KAU51_04310 [Candidatus Parcubacteria bacterium]|nr:hypothetical protein [Candidatus Parcubacteria bacterium]
MIKTLKNTIKEIYDWIKDKVIRFKKWLIIFIFGAAVVAAPLIIPTVPEQIIYNPEYVNAPENNMFKIRQLNYDAVLAKDITSEQPLKYQLDDKYISFKPVEIRWDNKKLKDVSETVEKLDGEKKYKSVFGNGIDIEMGIGDRNFKKIVKINSLDNLGDIPKNVKYLEIEFEVDTNLIVDGWNKKDYLEVTDKVRLGNYSYLDPAYVWDSYSEEVCWEEMESSCDPECIEDTEICDVCEIETRCKTKNNKKQIISYFDGKDDKLYYTKKIPIEYLNTAQYPIYTDADVTYGTAENYSTTSTTNTTVKEVNTNKFVVCYTDVTDGYSGQCIAATVNGTDMTWGSVSEFDNDTRGRTSLCKLDTDKFAVVYADDVLTDDGYARAVTVSGTTIGSWGTAKEIETGDLENSSCDGIDTSTDKFVACYNDETNSDSATCVVATVSGTTITNGTPVMWESLKYRADSTVTKKNGNNKFISAARVYESGDVDNLVIVGTVSGTTITLGTEVSPTGVANIGGYLGLAIPDTDKFVVTFYGDVSTYHQYAYVGTVSGTTITIGSQYETIASIRHPMQSAEAIDTTTVLLALSSYPDYDGKSQILTPDFSDRTLTYNSPETWDAGTFHFGSNVEVALIDTNKVVICYVRDDANDYGECIIGDVSVAPAERRIIIIE